MTRPASLHTWLCGDWTGKKGETYKIKRLKSSTWHCTRLTRGGGRKMFTFWLDQPSGKVWWGSGTYYFDPAETAEKPNLITWHHATGGPPFVWTARKPRDENAQPSAALTKLERGTDESASVQTLGAVSTSSERDGVGSDHKADDEFEISSQTQEVCAGKPESPRCLGNLSESFENIPTDGDMPPLPHALLAYPPGLQPPAARNTPGFALTPTPCRSEFPLRLPDHEVDVQRPFKLETVIKQDCNVLGIQGGRHTQPGPAAGEVPRACYSKYLPGAFYPATPPAQFFASTPAPCYPEFPPGQFLPPTLSGQVYPPATPTGQFYPAKMPFGHLSNSTGHGMQRVWLPFEDIDCKSKTSVSTCSGGFTIGERFSV